MKLARKFTLAIIAGIVIVHAGSVVVRVHREIHLFERDVARDEKVLGRALSTAAESLWQTRGERDVRDLIARATERESQVHIRWVWLDAPDGGPDAPVIPARRLETVAPGRAVSIRSGEDDALYTYVATRTPGGRLGAIEISDALSDERSYLQRSILYAVAAALALVLLCAAIAWMLGIGLVGRPMRRLVEQARRIGAGDLGQRLRLEPRDEIGELAVEMDHMCDGLQEAWDRVSAETQGRVKALEQLRHADRLKTVGTLASGLAHELGTPLNVVKGHAQLIREAARDPAIDEHVDVISRQCARMTQIIGQLLTFSRRGRGNAGSSDLRTVIDDTLSMVGPLANKRRVDMQLHQATDQATARIAPAPMQQVLANLIINGLHAMSDGGTLQVTVDREENAAPDAQRPGDYLRVTIADTGIGMDPATVERIFEPFFTTKEVGEGTGLGLSVAHGIVEDHGGWIEVDSEPGRGSRFSVYLPAEAA